MRQHILLNHVGVAGSFEAALQGFDEGPEVDNANSEEAEELDHLDADGIRKHMKRVIRVRTPRNVDDLANCRGDDSFACQYKESKSMMAILTVFEHNRIVSHSSALSAPYSRGISAI